MAVGDRQNLNFSEKQPGFSEIIQICLNLGLEFWIARLVLPNYKKITPKKPILI